MVLKSKSQLSHHQRRGQASLTRRVNLNYFGVLMRHSNCCRERWFPTLKRGLLAMVRHEANFRVYATFSTYRDARVHHPGRALEA